MKYKLWVMSSIIELEANNIDEAICVGLLHYQQNIPIAVYDTDEKASILFPYDDKKVDEVLSNMWDRIKESYNSITFNK